MLAVGALPPASLLLRTSLVLLLIGALLFTCLGGVVPSRKLDLDNWAAWIWTRLFDYEAASATAAAVTPPLATSIVGYCVSVTSVEMMPMAIQLALTLRSFGSAVVLEVYSTASEDAARFFLRSLRWTVPRDDPNVIVHYVDPKNEFDWVRADLDCIRALEDNPHWHYIVKMSGDTFPLFNGPFIEEALKKSEPSSFIGMIGSYGDRKDWRNYVHIQGVTCLEKDCLALEGTPNHEMIYFGHPSYQLHRGLASHIANASDHRNDQWERSFRRSSHPDAAYVATRAMELSDTYSVKNNSLTWAAPIVPDWRPHAKVLTQDRMPDGSAHLFGHRFVETPCFLQHVICPASKPLLLEP